MIITCTVHWGIKQPKEHKHTVENCLRANYGYYVYSCRCIAGKTLLTVDYPGVFISDAHASHEFLNLDWNQTCNFLIASEIL